MSTISLYFVTTLKGSWPTQKLAIISQGAEEDLAWVQEASPQARSLWGRDWDVEREPWEVSPAPGEPPSCAFYLPFQASVPIPCLAVSLPPLPSASRREASLEMGIKK